MMARQSASARDEFAAIEALVGDLEKRLHKLNNAARQQASEAGDMMTENLAELAERLRAGAESLSETVADKAGRLGDDALEIGGEALRRLEEEIEQRPLMTLAIVAGIGFLIGMAARRR
jgi:ElaB/YqjD/DUF883 family membrane-anchored ribosome-binding protein